VEKVLRLEHELLGGGVLPAGRAQIAERDLALAVVELGHLAELQRVAVAGVAGEVVENASARGHGGIAARLRQREIVDRPMRGQAPPRRTAALPGAGRTRRPPPPPSTPPLPRTQVCRGSSF